MENAPKMKLIKFSSLACPPCQNMARLQTLEKFVAKHPNVELIKHETADANWETPKGTPFAEANKLSKKRKISALPTLIFEVEDGEELIRVEHALNARDLERAYLDALDELAPDEDDEDDDENDSDEDENDDE